MEHRRRLHRGGADLGHNTSANSTGSHTSAHDSRAYTSANDDSRAHANANSAAHVSADDDSCASTKLLQMVQQLRWKLRIGVLQQFPEQLRWLRRHLVCPLSTRIQY